MLPSEQGNDAHPPLAETNVSRAGVGSASCTLEASEGPLFVTVIVYVTLLPGVVVPGPLFATERSAFRDTVPVTVEELFPEFGSGVYVELTVAVLLIVPLAFDARE